MARKARPAVARSGPMATALIPDRSAPAPAEPAPSSTRLPLDTSRHCRRLRRAYGSSAQRPSREVDEDVLQGRRPELDVAGHEAVLREDGGGRRDELRGVAREIQPH